MTLRSLVGSWFAPLLIHNLNQTEALQRAAQAQAIGLNPAEYGTVFPGSNVTTNTTNNTGGGWLKGAILSAALLATGGAGALGVGRLLPASTPTAAGDRVAPAPPAVQVTPPVSPAGGWDAITEEQQPDGSWKIVKRQALTVPPAAPKQREAKP